MSNFDTIWSERRLKDEKRQTDKRSEWARDYARIIHSSAFRRLQSKTQVLGLGESDFYRTRLTHSMEVSQIGVGITRWLKDKYDTNEEIKSIIPSTALMSSICLAHDLGHPPFGHGGEVALNFCMRNYGGFEGNGQTLRILSSLDKYTEKNGLNPTRRLLLGVLKYPASYTNTVYEGFYGKTPDTKWLFQAKEQKPPKCYLDDEDDVVNFILEPLSNNERKIFTEVEEKYDEDDKDKRLHNKPKYKSFDTSIMELADDISYSLHDLEDAISLGMITMKNWEKHNDKKDALYEACGLKNEEVKKQLFSEHSFQRKKMIGELVHRFITNTFIKPTKIQNVENLLIKWNACLEPEHKTLLDHIFTLVKSKVIKSSNVQQLEFKGQKMIVELFDALNSDPKRLLPSSTLKRLESAKKDGITQERVICDFIAGMTDEYATRLYEKLFYPHKGSIFDRL
ncbi:anti-phage deoxyguanosine triphosphatase [Acinetobacter baumannii]